jgi:hypothetical protein
MRIFVGFGYNERDRWIEDQVVPILRSVGYTVVDGKDLVGQQLQSGVEQRIEKSDAAIGFFTIRDGQGDADYTSHIWVRDEMLYAKAKNKPMVLVREDGVKLPQGLFGDIGFITLDQADRLACVAAMLAALGQKQMRRLRLDPSEELRPKMYGWRNNPGFLVRYRTLSADGYESNFREGRLELVDQGFYLNVAEVPAKAYVEVEGVLNNAVQFSSGWVSADAVQVKVF